MKKTALILVFASGIALSGNVSGVDIVVPKNPPPVAPKENTAPAPAPAVYKKTVAENIEYLKKGLKEKTLGSGAGAGAVILDLSVSGDIRAVPVLEEILTEYDLKDRWSRQKEPSWYIRKSAAEALGWIGEPSSARVLRKAYQNDSNGEVKNAANFSFFQIQIAQSGYKINSLPIPEKERPKAALVLDRLSKNEDEIVSYSASWAYLTWLNGAADENRKKGIITSLKKLSKETKDKHLKLKNKKLLSEYSKGGLNNIYPYIEK